MEKEIKTAKRPVNHIYTKHKNVKRLFLPILIFSSIVLVLAITYPGFSQTRINSQKRIKDWLKMSPSSSEEVRSLFPAVNSGYINDINSMAIRDFIRRFDHTPNEN